VCLAGGNFETPATGRGFAQVLSRLRIAALCFAPCRASFSRLGVAPWALCHRTVHLLGQFAPGGARLFQNDSCCLSDLPIRIKYCAAKSPYRCTRPRGTNEMLCPAQPVKDCLVAQRRIFHDLTVVWCFFATQRSFKFRRPCGCAVTSLSWSAEARHALGFPGQIGRLCHTIGPSLLLSVPLALLFQLVAVMPWHPDKNRTSEIGDTCSPRLFVIQQINFYSQLPEYLSQIVSLVIHSLRNYV